MIEIDSDGHRSGVQPEDAVLIEIGQVLHEGGAKLKGVLTHAGSSYDLNTPEALQKLAEQERRLSVRAAERLRAAGLPCPEVSVGSTPTALSAQSLDGVTEVRAGVYVFFDLVMANVGVCTPRERGAVGADDGDRPSAREGLGDRRRRLDGDEPRPRHAAPEDRLWLRHRLRC